MTKEILPSPQEEQPELDSNPPLTQELASLHSDVVRPLEGMFRDSVSTLKQQFKGSKIESAFKNMPPKEARSLVILIGLMGTLYLLGRKQDKERQKETDAKIATENALAEKYKAETAAIQGGLNPEAAMELGTAKNQIAALRQEVEELRRESMQTEDHEEERKQEPEQNDFMEPQEAANLQHAMQGAVTTLLEQEYGLSREDARKRAGEFLLYTENGALIISLSTALVDTIKDTSHEGESGFEKLLSTLSLEERTSTYTLVFESTNVQSKQRFRDVLNALNIERSLS